MLVRRIRKRGANIVVEAHGEVLFSEGADIGRWKNRFSHRVSEAVEAAAPTNKRPRWAHYGKPLKSTITSSTSTRLTKGGGFFYIATGSRAPHAYYVDQGTGIYNSSTPYQAKILPPWRQGSPTLYEATWRAGGTSVWNRPSRPVYIKGQKGQFFFDAGLKRAFQSMRMRSFQVPGEGVSGISSAMNTFPSGLANFAGNTPASAGFIAQLQEWRAWRDDAFFSGTLPGYEGDGRRASGAKKPKKPKAAKPPKKPTKQPTKPTKPTKPKKMTAEQRSDIARAIGAQLRAQGRQFRNLTVSDDGTWSALVKAPRSSIFKPVTGRWRK